MQFVAAFFVSWVLLEEDMEEKYSISGAGQLSVQRTKAAVGKVAPPGAQARSLWGMQLLFR